MVSRIRMKVVVTFAASVASVAALVPTVGHAETTQIPPICIPCLEPCGPVCFVNVAPAADALPASTGTESLFSE